MFCIGTYAESVIMAQIMEREKEKDRLRFMALPQDQAIREAMHRQTVALEEMARKSPSINVKTTLF